MCLYGNYRGVNVLPDGEHKFDGDGDDTIALLDKFRVIQKPIFQESLL